MRYSHYSAQVLLFIASLLLLGSCASVPLQDVVTTERPLQLESYFAGKTRAEGILLDRKGAASRYFTADIVGTWTAATQTLVLDERFVFTDGERSQRIWTIKKHSPTHYTGTAPDVVGTAEGQVKGNVLNWRYVLQVPYQGQTLNVDFDDWLFLMTDKVMLNKAIMRKFGLQVGEILISFEKLD